MIDRLKEFRKKYFKNQKEFADCLNVSRAMVSEYENGNYNIGIDKLIVLAGKYNLNINWLLTGNGSMILNDDDNINIHKELERLRTENNLLKELIKK